jgi:hypothetical protein
VTRGCELRGGGDATGSAQAPGAYQGSDGGIEGATGTLGPREDLGEDGEELGVERLFLARGRDIQARERSAGTPGRQERLDSRELLHDGLRSRQPRFPIGGDNGDVGRRPH